MLGLTIGEKHTAYDFGLRLLTFNVSSPEPVVNEIEIPGMDGNLDLSETLTGEIIYKKRKLTAEFLMEEHDETELQKRTDAIRNYLHGITHTICPDMDSIYEYVGRVTVAFAPMGVYQTVTVTANVAPYKTKRMNTVVSKFITDEEVVSCYNERKSVIPTITTDADFQIEFKGDIYSVSAGESIIPEILFRAGDNVLTCTGSGTITFTYQEGSL